MKAHIRWLLDELPQLQRDGVLDAATVQRLQARYASIAAAGGWGRVLFPLLGTVLIALGIVLLVAHNWDQFGRSLRVMLAFSPLLAGQLACAWTLSRARDSLLWREASAAFTALAFAAALALVGQIYHFPGDLDRYLLSCALLALPLVYALDAVLAAVLCALALGGWAWAAPGDGPSVFAVAGLFALLLPLAWQRLRRDPQALGTAWLLAVLAPAFFIAVLSAMQRLPGLWLWWLAGFGAMLSLLPAPLVSSSLWRRPLRSWGGVAVALAALIGSVPDVWRDGLGLSPAEHLPQAWAFLVLGMALLAVLGWRAWRRGERSALLHAVPACVTTLAVLAGDRAPAVVLALLFSAWLLLAGIAAIRSGLREQDAGRATRGLALIAALVMLRFIDNEWSFTLRGIAFVLTGAAFVATHLWLRRRVRA